MIFQPIDKETSVSETTFRAETIDGYRYAFVIVRRSNTAHGVLYCLAEVVGMGGAIMYSEITAPVKDASVVVDSAIRRVMYLGTTPEELEQ